MRKQIWKRWLCSAKEQGRRLVTVSLAVALLVSALPLEATAANPPHPSSRPVAHPARQPKATSPAANLPDSIPVGNEPGKGPEEVIQSEIQLNDGHMVITPVDTVAVLTAGEAWAADSIAGAATRKEDEWIPRDTEFNPDPTKAVWFAALFPGLGQVYNRRYWKLPIIVGGYLGLAYATNWNSSMLTDYTKAYADLLDNDPDTRSYMDLFSPNVKEENLDKSWLRNVLRSRKNYFRRNRDLCIIAMIGVYLVAMVDAYVDASLSHFDITPDLTMDLAPALIQDGRQRYPSVGLVWALNF
ncbi:MAG: hypothetical protein K2H14_06695 [Muribaculaceae bacterium]|nr:hypothetical protein [Muribaculaceae bacterium]